MTHAASPPSLSRISPLLARVAPIPGESLLSLVTRACEANVFRRQGGLLAFAGVAGAAAFAPFTALDGDYTFCKPDGESAMTCAWHSNGSLRNTCRQSGAS